jgi:MFS family permease
MSTVAAERDLDIRRAWLHYGWVNVVIAAIAMGATFPGRTHGLGMFTQAILSDIDLTEQRGFYGSLNLWATLIGALFCLPIGWMIDRFGSRLVLTVIYVTFGASVVWMSQAGDWPELFGALILTRGLGQSALSVVSITMVAKWFQGRSLTIAMACYSVLMGMAFAGITKLVSYALESNWDWRQTLAVIGWTLLAGLAPLSLIFTRSTPKGSHAEKMDENGLEGATLGDALTTPAFWVFSLAVSFYGLISSGIFLFNEEIFKDNNIAREAYHEALMISFVAGLASKFAAAWLSGYWGINRLLSLSMAVLMAALLALPMVHEAWHAYLYAIAMSISGGVVALVFFAIWGQVFGRREVGRIQGIAQMLTVLASAVGPLLFGMCRDYSGSYLPMFLGMAPVAFGRAAHGLTADGIEACPMPGTNQTRSFHFAQCERSSRMGAYGMCRLKPVRGVSDQHRTAWSLHLSQ